MAEISEVVKMLCARMETNPEDFMYTRVGVYQTPKFHQLGEGLRLRAVNVSPDHLSADERLSYMNLWHYTDDELALLTDSYHKMYRKQNEIQMLDILFNGDEREQTHERIAKHLAQSMHGIPSVLQPGFKMTNTTATSLHMADPQVSNTGFSLPPGYNNQLNSYSASGVTNGNK